MSEPLFLHASAVVLGETGVLIRGPSGAGKSALALALVEDWRRAGDFAALVGDDRIAFRIAGGRGLLAPHAAIEGLAEWRGIGLVARDWEPCAVLGLLVDLEPESALPAIPRMPEESDLYCAFNGLEGVPRLRLPARALATSVPAIRIFLQKISAF